MRSKELAQRISSAAADPRVTRPLGSLKTLASKPEAANIKKPLDPISTMPATAAVVASRPVSLGTIPGYVFGGVTTCSL